MTAYSLFLVMFACGPKTAVPTEPGPPVSAPGAADMPTALPDLDKLLDTRDPVASEAAYRALLPQAQELGIDVELGLLTRVARTLGLQNRFDEAIALLDEVEARAGGAGPEVYVRLLLEDGRVLNSGGQSEASAAFFEEAYSRAQEAGLEALAVDAAHMLGIVLPPDPALEWNLQAITAAEASDDHKARDWLGALYNNTGWTLMERGEYAQALVLFKKGLAWRQQRDNARATRIAGYTVAAACRKLGRCQEALPLLNALLEQWQAAGEEDGYLHEELGECLLELGQQEASVAHFAAASRLLSQDSWLVAHEPERLARLAELGGQTGQ